MVIFINCHIIICHIVSLSAVIWWIGYLGIISTVLCHHLRIRCHPIITNVLRCNTTTISIKSTHINVLIPFEMTRVNWSILVVTSGKGVGCGDSGYGGEGEGCSVMGNPPRGERDINPLLLFCPRRHGFRWQGDLAGWLDYGLGNGGEAVCGDEEEEEVIAQDDFWNLVNGQ